MPRLRLSGGTNRPRAASATTRPPMVMTPSVGAISPATICSVVVLPHPDGPSSVTNSPSATVRSTPRTATASPYRFVTPASVTSAMHYGSARISGGTIFSNSISSAGIARVIVSQRTLVIDIQVIMHDAVTHPDDVIPWKMRICIAQWLRHECAPLRQ